MEPIRVFVVDDHPMVRHGLAAMLSTDSGLAWVGEATDGIEAIGSVPPVAPDVVLMDLVMPRLDGVAAIEVLRPKVPQTRFLVLTHELEPVDVRRALTAGATGFLLKNASAQELVTAVRAAYRGQLALPPEVTEALAASERHHNRGGDLTQRERELLALMALGLSNQDISTRLSIAMPTVKFHVTNILAKLHAENRTEAVLIALRYKLVQLE
jgi:NarL family two-component system response regulator LiaR